MEANPQNGSQREATQGRSSAAGAAQGAGGSAQQGGQSAQSAQSARGSERQSGRSDGGRAVAPRRSSTELMTPASSPLAVMMQLSRDMDRMFESFFGRPFGMPSMFSAWPFERASTTGMPTLWSPQIDVSERDDSIVVRADLPGVNRDDIRIEATDGGLAISGERRSEREEGDQNYRLSECTYGKFYRTIPLPEGANTEAAKASMRDGVLEVTIPSEQSRKRRQIRIES